MIKKGIKLFGIAIAGMVIIVLVTATLFINLSPQFGGSPSKAQQQQYAQSAQFKDGIFVNAIPTTRDIGFVNTIRVLYDFLFKELPGLEPASPLPVQKIDSLQIIGKPPALKRLTWFGHSACLLEMEGKRIFFDPMLGKSPSPHPLLGPKRYSKELPINIDKLPFIDAVVLSHDHYDHLDYESIIKLKDKVGRFYVPLGVGVHLEKWNVPAEKIIELDWWQESKENGFTFICTPARHFSGRGLFNGFTTLWASWVVKTDNSNVYFSGDSGYGPHFKEIGNKYGPFDFVMLECGQYNELWKDIHMMPEQTVEAALDLKGKLMMPIHWGAFTLAMHTWTDPINRVTTRAHERLVPITTPKIGEAVVLQQPEFPHSTWWK
ncbi:MBL fold metallo-hydrolase [Chryseolinea sp. H1M3-3]|uniref:MBL fold metallo-hydrolase n=1 Tax=Chryseolinea sp. H1M3-3 TaxID=3034144 RepID=UPI0023EB46F2|nr:MBL fold metallo-hydrolase [Chryseolinea sp. H1M3-3]